MKVSKIQKELENYIDLAKKEYLPKFFKTKEGEYAYGDSFLGITVPNVRKVAKNNINISFSIIEELLGSKWHECRLCGLLILVLQFKKSDFTQRKMIYDFYISNTKYINNWDLVDASASYIVGEFLKKETRTKLYELVQSDSLWEKRIAVVSTIVFIKNNDFVDIIKLSEILMQNKQHDLIQKAMGWMLRELGKMNIEVFLQFLDKYSKTMPRTMLRYSIEKLTPKQRMYYMQ